MKYRKLHDFEIERLIGQGCTADSWDNLQVDEEFSTDFVVNVRFTGKSFLGKFSKIFKFDNGIEQHSGIYNAHLHNCTIENDVYISHVHNYLANYTVGQDSYIANVGTVSADKGSAFGNGVMVAAVNENGGRKIPIFDNLSSQMAHLLVFYRQKKSVISHIFSLIENYSKKIAENQALIGQKVFLNNCGEILNIKIGDGAVLCAVAKLCNGSINSTLDAPCEVGTGVVATDFIFASSSKITDNVLINRCFVGEGCEISNGFSATDSLFFANCEMMNGEAVSVFAAPYSCSHHKSSLLIASALSFANIGSGTNMSNHAYKLGAVHQGVMDRGCKTASNSYMHFPTHTGAFSTIFGTHKNHLNVSDLPFSFLVEENGVSYLSPAINLFRLGILRDVNKWQNRDKRKCKNHLDLINYDMLNPFIINKIEKGIEVLQSLKEKTPEAEYFEYGNCKIRNNALKRGIEYYKDAITVFIGNFLLNGKNFNLQKTEDCMQWVDLSGVIMPKCKIDYLFDNIENYKDINQIKEYFHEIYKNYDEYYYMFMVSKKYLPTSENIKTILEQYVFILVNLKKRIVLEANREFFGTSKISYGIDYNEDKDSDFEAVRGVVETNTFVNNCTKEIQQKIDKARISQGLLSNE
ncbi:MAG: DUF4954 family protein [Prevotellaceae bacterium]|jgi:hypothetical protein|nr:DUF4954 family protein [Prevotellaceae bacterium]